jgi:hypothetical protein
LLNLCVEFDEAVEVVDCALLERGAFGDGGDGGLLNNATSDLTLGIL